MGKIYSKGNGKQFIRMDTGGENFKLIDYYKKCGVQKIDTIDLEDTFGLPYYYKGKLALLEIAICNH